MNELIQLKKYTKPKDIKHVMYYEQEIEQIFDCKTCGKLQVIDGIVWHIKSKQEHDNG